MKEQIKELRVKIDGLSQLTKTLKSNYEGTICKEPCCAGHLSKETEKTYDSLILAKAWLGKVLGELGTKSPYKSGYKTVEDIEPTADVNKEVEIGNAYWETLTGWGDKNHVEKIDWLRQEIEKIKYEFSNFMINWSEYNSNLEFKLSQGKITSLGNITYQHLCEARFWLGFELQRIKENGNNS